MFHCLVIKVVCLSSLCDSLFTLSYLSNLVKHFFQKFFQTFKKLYKVVCFCRSVQATWLLYHKFSHLSTVNLNFLKTFFHFSVFQKQFLATACLLYHCRGESSSTFYKKSIFFVQVIIAYFFKYYFSIYFHKRKHKTYLLIIYRMAS